MCSFGLVIIFQDKNVKFLSFKVNGAEIGMCYSIKF